jgi:hypothetical protein
MGYTLSSFKAACDLEEIDCQYIDVNNSVARLTYGGVKKIIINTRLGLLSDSEWWLLRDKYYSYLMFGKDLLFPHTESFIDPIAMDHYHPFVRESSIAEIKESIVAHFSMPVVIKRNSGTQGQNVFVCNNEEKIITSLESIYSKHQLAYDHVALAQIYIKPSSEYRIIVFNSKFEFAYHKPHSREEFGINDDVRLISDLHKIDRMKSLIKQVTTHFPLAYAGVDVIEDDKGKMWVIEINGSPTYTRFIEDNGDDLIIPLFRRIARQLVSK